MNLREGYLVLEDGSVYSGRLNTGDCESAGEVVFNTSMSGYEQIATDPSYAGQIVVLTYPLIGNYGVNPENLESDHPWLKGMVVRDLCEDEGGKHYQQKMSFKQFLAQNRVPCLSGVDTRALARHLRMRGTMGGVLASSLKYNNDLIERARRAMQPPAGGYALQAGRQNIVRLGAGRKRLLLMDFGTKKSMVDALLKRKNQVIVVPAHTSPEKIKQLAPDAIVLSNGPGDPGECTYAIETIRKLLGCQPMLGICLGHQLLSLALGASTYKLKFGHRGANHPVKDLTSGRIYISAQNHGYAVEPNSLVQTGAELWFQNLNDNSVEGIIHREMNIRGVQFHPEAAPGPQDTRYLIDDFLAAMA
ncbi:carbamoyl phosphate synthase small subunit [Syntrophomonas curvata]